MANLVFIPTTKTSTTSGLTLDEIPQEVKDDAEEVYKVLKDNPNGRMGVEFASVGELNAYLLQIKTYCELRPAELGGPIYFRRSPTPKQSPKNPDGLKPTQAQFRITDKTENEIVTEEIRDAVDNVKAAKR